MSSVMDEAKCVVAHWMEALRRQRRELPFGPFHLPIEAEAPLREYLRIQRQVLDSDLDDDPQNRIFYGGQPISFSNETGA